MKKIDKKIINTINNGLEDTKLIRMTTNLLIIEVNIKKNPTSMIMRIIKIIVVIIIIETSAIITIINIISNRIVKNLNSTKCKNLQTKIVEMIWIIHPKE